VQDWQSKIGISGLRLDGLTWRELLMVYPRNLFFQYMPVENNQAKKMMHERNLTRSTIMLADHVMQVLMNEVAYLNRWAPWRMHSQAAVQQLVSEKVACIDTYSRLNRSLDSHAEQSPGIMQSWGQCFAVNRGSVQCAHPWSLMLITVTHIHTCHAARASAHPRPRNKSARRPPRTRANFSRATFHNGDGHPSVTNSHWTNDCRVAG